MSINRRRILSSGLGAAAFFSTGSVFNPTRASEPVIELVAGVSKQKLYGEKGAIESKSEANLSAKV